MEFALTEEGQRVKAIPNGRAICPNCKSLVIAKCGDFNLWHWAHDNIENCDNWTYEPKTEWHVKWQNLFNENQREVFISKFSETHIADILTETKLVIEIQNSSITSTEVFERENFYDRMIWVINSKEFIHNLILKEFKYDLYKEVWFRWVNQYATGDEKAFAIIVPYDDMHDRILPILKTSKYKKAFDKKKDTEFWYNQRKKFQQPLEKEILNAFAAYVLDTKMVNDLDDDKHYPTNIKWLHLRKTWTSATKPLFIDLNNGYLLYIKTLYENGNGFGKVISKRAFLKKYRT